MIQNDSVDSKSLETIINFLSEKTGMNFRETHKAGIIRYIKGRTVELKISYDNFFTLIKTSENEFNSLVNASTINETYFFREESQFDLAKKLLASKTDISIWSAACSSGEEIYSLKLLCDSINIHANFFATDINSDKLNILKKGEYLYKQSIRELDGKSYHNLLSPFITGDRIIFNDSIKNSIKFQRINLTDFNSYPDSSGKFNLIFLRNVFIYFSIEQRYKILNYIAENFLSEDGYIFVSLSETAQFEEKRLSNCLEKICINDVFLFHKKSSYKAEVNYE